MSAPGARKVATTRRKPAPKPLSDAAVAAALLLNDQYPLIDAVGFKWSADDAVGYGLAGEWSGWPLPELALPESEVAAFECPVCAARYFYADTRCAVSYVNGEFADHDRTLVRPVSAP